MNSKHIKLGNKLAEVQFSANSFKIVFGVEMFKSLLTKNSWILL